MAKNYNFLADLKHSDYIDCKDTVNHWCVGEVIDVDPDKNMIKIHFEGWTNRYDEVWSSSKQNFNFVLIVDQEELPTTGSLQTTHRGLHRTEESSLQRLQNKLHSTPRGK
jgi:hypothetical protein